MLERGIGITAAAGVVIGSVPSWYPEKAPLRAEILLSMRSLREEVVEGLWVL